MRGNWKAILTVVAVVGLTTAAMAQPGGTFKRGGWDPPPGGWDIVFEGASFSETSNPPWYNGNSSGDPGLDGNSRTWADNWDADDVTIQTIAGSGETEDGANTAANATVLQLQDNYTGGDNGHGRRLKFGTPFPGTYDTGAAGDQRAANIVNARGGLTFLVRFRVMPGTLVGDTGQSGGRLYAHEFVGFDASTGMTGAGDADRGGIEIGNDVFSWGADTDPFSTFTLVGDLTNRFHTFWFVIEPGVNLDNWKGTLWMDGSLTQVCPTWGGPGDVGADGGLPMENVTDNWFAGGDQFTVTAGASNYPELAGKAMLIIGPAQTGSMVTWQYDYICAKAGAFRPTATPATPPNPPSSLSATAPSSKRVQLNWADNATNEDGFKIERKVGTGAFVQIDTAPANATSYLDTTASPDTDYTYRVRAYNAAGDSGYSNEIAIRTPLAELGAQNWQLYDMK
jgi:hypothetical protein